MRVLAVLQIQAELRKQPGVVWPEVKHRTARAVPLALPASPCRLHSRLSLGTCNYIGVAQAARWVQTVAELRKQPGGCNYSGAAQAARCHVARGKSPDGSRRTACITGLRLVGCF